jgi:hypothetical protein
VALEVKTCLMLHHVSVGTWQAPDHASCHVTSHWRVLSQQRVGLSQRHGAVFNQGMP